MAFVNEKMTPEETKMIADMKIKTHGPGVYTIKPRRWTIDREKNMFLVYVGYEPENSDVIFFIFFWKNNPIRIKLYENYISSNTIRWEIRREEEKSGNSGYIHIPIELVRNDKGEIDRSIGTEIVNDVKEAFRVYGYDGTISQNIPNIENKKNVEFDF